MSPDRWEQVKALLQAAIERGTPEERIAFLDEACRDDLMLRNEVELLLSAHHKANSFMEQPAAEIAALLFADSSSNFVEGQTIGSYKILKKLGAGGMGTVYLALDTRLGRKAALKLLPEHFTNDLGRVRRFQQEARAASLLNHPNIVTIYEVGQAKERDFIATEFVEGETLRERMIHEGLSLIDALTIATQIASATAEAHTRGIIHRDIKPENIMLRPDGFVKVLDFGLAKLTEKLIENQPTGFRIPTSKIAYTEPGMVMGTAKYMSPEQAQGLAVDERTDIWSFGAVLYEMLTGNAPFDGPTMSHVIVAILEQEPAPLTQHPPELQRIVMKSLRKDRTERYQTIKEILTDLNNLKQEIEFEGKFKDTKIDPNKTFTDQTISQKIQHQTEVLEPNPQTDPTLQKPARAKYIIDKIKNNKVVAALVLIVLLIAASIISPTITTLMLLIILFITAIAGRNYKRIIKIGIVTFALIVSIIAAVAGIYYILNKPALRFEVGDPRDPRPFTEKGNYKAAVISRDGQHLFYVKEENDGQQSLWRRAFDSGGNVSPREAPIASPAKIEYRALNISPDNKTLYYIDAQGSLYQMQIDQMPASGASKIAEGLTVSSTNGQIGISYTGEIAYVRSNGEGVTELFTKAAGEHEQRFPSFEPYKTIVAHIKEGNGTRSNTTFGFPIKLHQTLAWSWDGKLIACVGTIAEDKSHLPIQFIVVLQIADGKYQAILETDIRSIENLIWMPDSKSFLVRGKKMGATLNRIWQISYPDVVWKTQIIPDDTIKDYDYSSLSLTADGRSLVAVRYEQIAHVWRKRDDGEKQITNGDDNYDGTRTLGWMSNHNFFYDTRQDIMRIDGDEEPKIFSSIVSSWAAWTPINREYPFVTIEGTGDNPKRLMRISSDKDKKDLELANNVGDWAAFSDEGNSVFYKGFYFYNYDASVGVQKDPAIWKVSIKGGESELICRLNWGEDLRYPILSPRSDKIAYVFFNAEYYRIGIIRGNGDNCKIEPLNTKLDTAGNINWTPEGDAILYIVHDNGVSNIWRQPIDNSSPKKITQFEKGSILNFAYSPDGKELVLSRGTFKSDIVLFQNIK